MHCSVRPLVTSDGLAHGLGQAYGTIAIQGLMVPAHVCNRLHDMALACWPHVGRVSTLESTDLWQF
jgi:hypothetical protein